MPTDNEMSELIRECTWTWTTRSGVKGFLVSSKRAGYTNRSIFLPAAGIDIGSQFGENINPDLKDGVFYWTSSLNPDDSCEAGGLVYYHGSDGIGLSYDDVQLERCYGIPIRPVSD